MIWNVTHVPPGRRSHVCRPIDVRSGEMGVNFKDRWSVPSTAVAHEFIDQYMAVANGEYVKVYLFVLRHQGEDITIERIADALDHTESDVRRALAYWEKLGILAGTRKEAPASCAAMGRQDSGPAQPRDASAGPQPSRTQASRSLEVHEPPAHDQGFGGYGTNGAMSREIHGQGTGIQAGYAQGPEVRGIHGQGAGIQDAHAQGTVGQGRREQGQTSREDRDKPVYSAEQVNRLSQDEGFSQLLYICLLYTSDAADE